MSKSKTSSQSGAARQGTPAHLDSVTGGTSPDSPQKKRGNLAATLDPLLQPRIVSGQPGRPKGASNYEWTPESDIMLAELCDKWGAAKAKRIMARRIQEGRLTGSVPKPDSVRKAVEHRMEKLGIASGRKRKQPDVRNAKRWTESETTALLGALGADATIESIAARTGHSVKSIRAKLARLDYRIEEVHGFATFTVNALAALLHVTPRQIRRWKERGWLETKNRRITEDCLRRFLRAHPDRIPYASLGREDKVFLVDLGFPSPEATSFKRNVREILDGIGRQRNPRRPIRRDHPTVADVGQNDERSGDALTLTTGTSL
jgi:hypothetical protein